MLNSAEHEIFHAINIINIRLVKITNSSLLNIAKHENLSANMKMPTFVGIFIFISREDFMLS